MINRNENNAKVVWGVLAGLLVGGLAGATAMLLRAPQSGKKTRSQIRRKSSDLRKQTVDTVEGAVAQTRDTAGKVTDDVRDRVGELQKGGHDMLDEQRDHLSNTLKGWGKAVHS